MIYGNGTESDTVGRLLLALRKRLDRPGFDISFQLRGAPRGILPKLRWMTRGLIRDAREVADTDILVVHSALSLSVPLLAFARLMRKPSVAFVWDIYPASTRAAGNIRNPILLWLYAIAERAGYALCTVVLVPTADYLAHLPRRVSLRASVFALWLVDEPQRNVRDRDFGKELSLAFAGQLNSIRGLDDALRSVLAAFRSQTVRLDVYSSDGLPASVERLAASQPRLQVVHHGHLPAAELASHLENADFGLVSLDRAFALPAFPSKMMTYIGVGLPILYCGPPKAGIDDFLRETGLGISLSSPGQKLDSSRIIRDYRTARERFLAAEDVRFDGLLDRVARRGQ